MYFGKAKIYDFVVVVMMPSMCQQQKYTKTALIKKKSIFKLKNM